MNEVWKVVCTDRGHHTAKTLGTHRLLAHVDAGRVTELQNVPLERSENLGGRTRSERSQERIHSQEEGFRGWPLEGDVRPRPSTREYACLTCGRTPRVKPEALVRAVNILRDSDPTRREIDVSWHD